MRILLGVYWRNEKCIQRFCRMRKVKRRDHFEEKFVGGRMI
jgi:hypothetical protein